MKIRVVQVGKTKKQEIHDMVEEFLKRLRPFAKIEIIVIQPSPPSKTVTKEKCSEEEGARILKQLNGFALNGFTVAMDERGKEMTSYEFADFLNKFRSSGETLTFVIGGAYGLSENVKAHTDAILSLSKMTFTHEMVRAFLVEQIYRGFCILHKKEYHN
ncbi:23S rRNA (pseudouridine(1915)-N(3))-methyltransferase RlmH [Candidatus Peregrinibacteria bacterium]|nr:23S rRNA (pseudouridine(1915)-N(3))-methyltransferase RlmH [Candidatus Peregrinibacteria bacterium]